MPTTTDGNVTIETSVTTDSTTGDLTSGTTDSSVSTEVATTEPPRLTTVTTESNEGLPDGAIAGIVIGIVVVIVLIVTAVIFLKRRLILSDHHQARRPTAPALEEIKEVENRNRNDPQTFPLGETDNPGYEPDIIADQRPPERQQQAPDIHISVNPTVIPQTIGLDDFIPSPTIEDNTQIRQYDYPQHQNGPHSTTSGDTEGVFDVIYDHPQNSYSPHGSGEFGKKYDEDGNVIEDIYDTPSPTSVMEEHDLGRSEQTDSGEQVKNRTTPPPEGDADKKPDYINVEDWRNPEILPPRSPAYNPEDLGSISSQVPPPPSNEGHMAASVRRYVNVAEPGESLITEVPHHDAVAEQEESITLEGSQHDDAVNDNDERLDSHPYANMQYENVPRGNPLYANQPQIRHATAGNMSSMSEMHTAPNEDTYTYAD